jgi:hypothetical protein
VGELPYFVKQLNEHFTDEEHNELTEIKGNRTWRKAILEEFGVDDDE